VPEKDLSKIAPLQLRGPLAVQVKREDDWIQGKLFLINNKVDEKTGTLLLQAIFENQDWKLWPGEFVEVRLILKVEEKAILVPASAVQIGQNGSFVYVLKPDYTVEMRSVKVGQKEEDNRVIESGIKEDETIVTEGQLNLVDGAKALVKP
jgi:multidrug efflux system membrane fusion protein